MAKWVVKWFPSGQWSIGWLILVLAWICFVSLVCILMNFRDGLTWNGKDRQLSQ